MQELIRTLAQLLGNKRYLLDLETILTKLDLTPKERQTMQFLKEDLRMLETKHTQLDRKSKQTWKNW